MLLESFAQLNYRNLRTAHLTFEAGITAVTGANAAGKSNLLEAIYLCCTGDLPSSTIAESIALDESEGSVQAHVQHNEGSSRVQIGLAPGRKVIRLDGQTVRAFELAKVTSAVLITPEDAALVHGSPSLRRGYLDSLLKRISPRYALLLREYSRVVEQRNALLKAGVFDETLTVWSARFCELGDEINLLRKRAVARVNHLASARYTAIAGADKPLHVNLTSTPDALADALIQTAQQERARGVTVVGPHRADLALTLAGNSVQAFGSRGEARTTALALRIAEYELLRDKHDEAPVLLLDDFSAELDATRRDYLLGLAETTPQALVSGTEPPPSYRHHLRIEAGVAHVQDVSKRV